MPWILQLLSKLRKGVNILLKPFRLYGTLCINCKDCTAKGNSIQQLICAWTPSPDDISFLFIHFLSNLIFPTQAAKRQAKNYQVPAKSGNEVGPNDYQACTSIVYITDLIKFKAWPAIDITAKKKAGYSYRQGNKETWVGPCARSKEPTASRMNIPIQPRPSSTGSV